MVGLPFLNGICILMRVIIIGAGIGGLSAALALHQAGIEVALYERAHEFLEIGAGLTLWSNAIKALGKLGLGDALRVMGAPELQGEVRSSDGTLLTRFTLGELEKTFGDHSIVVHRAELLSALLEAVGEEVVHLDCTCVGFRQDQRGVDAYFSSGQDAHGDLLIGADGIDSVIRSQLFPNHSPRYAGYTAWRAVIPFENDRSPVNVSFQTLGRGSRFGFAHLSGGRVYWFATKNCGESGNHAGAKTELLGRFQNWHEPIMDVIQATDESRILRNDIYSLEPLERWTEGRVSLLGDAAHTMMPDLGQGACQAIEDSVVLGATLRQQTDTVSALKTYQARRIQRANAILKHSGLIGHIYQWENPFACWLRDRYIQVLPSQIHLRQLRWILGHEI